MAAYVIVEIDVKKQMQYEAYKKLAGPTVGAYGGKYIIRGGKAEVIEGAWKPERLVVLEFPNMEMAKAWSNSEEYNKARNIRRQCADTKMIIMEGF